MSVAKAPKACTRCATPKVNGRCPRCPLPAGERRAYSDTAEYRRVLAEVLVRDGAVCGYPGCGQPIAGVELEDDARGVKVLVDRRVADPLELAHALAHADNGAFTAENVFPSHRSCNRAAGRRPVEERIVNA